MAQTIQLKRSAQSGKVPDTGSLNLGELAVNTYDGKIFFKKSGSVESIQSVITTNSITTGSIELIGAITASIAATNGIFSGSSQIVSILTSLNSVSSSLISKTGSYATTGSNSFIANQQITGSLGVSGDVTVLGAINARQFNIGIISSSILYQSGSNKFGDTTDDTHQFTGSVGITGSLLINGVAVGGSSNSGSFTGSFSGSFIGDGSGLRGVVSDDLPIDGWDYQSNSSASISDFNVTSSKYLIDFEWDSEMGTPVGHKTFITNKSGSTQVVPTDYGVKFVVGNTVVATIDSNGIQASAPAGTVSGSSQLTSSYDSRYVLSGSITQTTWDNIASKPGGIVSGSSQVVGILSSLNTYTGSNDTTNTAQNARLTTIESVTGSYELKGSGIVSGSSQIVGVLSSLNTYTTSVDSKFTTLQTLTASMASQVSRIQESTASLNSFSSSTLGHITDINTKTGSFESKFTTLQTLTASVQTQISRIQESTASLNSYTSSNDTTNTAQNNRLTNLETTSASVNGHIADINSKTGSYAKTNSTNIFSGNQTITGSLFVSQDLVVAGSSSIQNISSSNLTIGSAYVTLNAFSPASRYAGLLIVDSGSAGSSGSLLYDAVDDEFIFVHKGNGTNITSSQFLMGPETYDNLGNEIYLTKNRITKGGNYEHLADSNINDDGTTISLNSNTQITGSLIISNGITGSIGATNGVVSGSSQTINYLNTAAPGVVSGSSQVVSILSSLNSFSASNGNTSLNTYSASIDTKFTTLQSLTASNSASIGQINSVTASLNAATSSYETKGRGIVSGSSQVDVMSTTNIARLATTGSNTFNGSITFSQAYGAQGAATDWTTVTNPTMKISPTTGYARIPHLSNGGSVSVVYNYETGKNVYWGEDTDTGTYFFRGRAANIGGSLTVGGNILPAANGTQDLGSSSYRWSTIYTSDLSLNNGIGDWTIVEGEDDLFLYNNKKGKVYKFALTEVDPSVATPKIS